MTQGPGRATALRLSVLALGGIVVAGCLPAPATREARAIADVYALFIGAGAVVLGIVWTLVTWTLIRHRRRRPAGGPTDEGSLDDEELPTQTRGNRVIEIVWTVLPLVTVLGLFVATLQALNTVDARESPSVRLDVTAFMWGWQATYPDSRRTLISTPGQPIEIVLPVGEPIDVTLTGRDVNHAFYVPSFLFKRDAIPGHTSTFQLRIENAGSYPGACAEFCGLLHDKMPFTIRAVDAAAYRAWLTAASPGFGSPGTSP
jgi:cytochrome c oxidase subunit 2